jgi:hypothetical protein
MKYYFLFILFCSQALAQVSQFDQSDPSNQWSTIQNSQVKIIYPALMQTQSIYVANLIEHYAHVIGQDFAIEQPEQFTLILRPQMAQPNGFVTLAPRRSEWFASSTFSPMIGSNEWYQTLAMHEYRHIIQYDYFKQDTVKAGRILFGDFGQQLLMFLGLPAWYFEGDAVYAETKYSDGGRGRSPRFLARIRAMVAAGKIPNYEQLMNGSYQTALPNHYVFGYILISRARQKFGEQVWSEVVKHIVKLPHPYRLYSSFKKITGQDFFDFYHETMLLLKQEWNQTELSNTAATDFRQHKYPHQNYYLKYTLDSYWELYRDQQKITQLPFQNELSHFSLQGNFAVYTQFLPDQRYGLKNYSDLIVIDLARNKKTKITDQSRIYHPRLNPSANKIIATEFTASHQWILQEFNLSGERLRKVVLPQLQMAEAAYLNDDNVVAIMSDRVGQKMIALLDLNNQKSQIILPSSRNNIFALSIDQKANIFFEAQYQSTSNIFMLDKNLKLSQCSFEAIAAYTPFSDGAKLSYSAEDLHGSIIKQIDLAQCRSLDQNQLISYNYLDQSISSNYNRFATTLMPEQELLFQQNPNQSATQTYTDFDSQLWTPHSWSFLAGRGFNLMAQTDNYLRTISTQVQIGSDAAENQNYAGFNFDYKKYYPIFSLAAGLRKRLVEPVNTNNQLNWDERDFTLKIILPYFRKVNLYNYSAELNGTLGQLKTSDYLLNNLAQSTEDQSFVKSSLGLSLKTQKDLTYRSLISPLALSYDLSFHNAKNNNDQFAAFQTFQKAQLQTPGIGLHHALQLIYTQEQQRNSQTAYSFLPIDRQELGNVFSRGHNYKNVPFYEKMSSNYLFPISNPDWYWGGAYYLRRLTGNLFYDHTNLYAASKKSIFSSYGVELEFESQFFRILPLNFGIRYVHRNLDDKNIGEFYLATQIAL